MEVYFFARFLAEVVTFLTLVFLVLAAETEDLPLANGASRPVDLNHKRRRWEIRSRSIPLLCSLKMAALICCGEASPLTLSRYSHTRMVSVGTTTITFSLH
jgi:hypothetical protein